MGSRELLRVREMARQKKEKSYYVNTKKTSDSTHDSLMLQGQLLDKFKGILFAISYCTVNNTSNLIIFKVNRNMVNAATWNS